MEFWESLSEASAPSELGMAWPPRPSAFSQRQASKGKGEGGERKGWWGREAWASLTDPTLAHGITSSERSTPPGLHVSPLHQVRSQEACSARKRLGFFGSVARAQVGERGKTEKGGKTVMFQLNFK